MKIKVQEPERLDVWLQKELKRTGEFKAATLKILSSLNNVATVSHLLKIPKATVYEWIREWNKKKEAFLKSHQGKGGGRPSKLDIFTKEQFRKALIQNKIKSVRDARQLLKAVFDVEYSEKQVSRILRTLDLKIKIRKA